MTIISNGNVVISNHDDLIKDTIDLVFQQPVESFEELQIMLAENKSKAKHDDTSVAASSIQTEIVMLTTPSVITSKELDDDNDLEVELLDDDTNINLPMFELESGVKNLKVDNFINKEPPNVYETNRKQGFLDNYNIKANNSKKDAEENLVDPNVFSPKVVVLNTIRPDDPFPGEAVAITNHESVSLPLKSGDLPKLSSTYYVERVSITTPGRSSTPQMTSDKNKSTDEVIPFILDDKYDYENCTHVPKFGQEIKDILFPS